MKISILTLFPEMFAGPFDASIIKRAKEKGLVDIQIINIRDFSIGSHKMVDDTPYGGGVGMVLKVDILHKAITYVKQTFTLKHLEGGRLNPPVDGGSHDSLKVAESERTCKTILLSASGKTYKQRTAQDYAHLDHLIIICGHYEGVDERILQYIDEEISIGDFVLTGGEIPAMLITDSVTRLLEGVITDGATADESFSEKNEGLLEYPHYTKPREYEGQSVPEVLLSGNHKEIDAWRRQKSSEKTKKIRPDLLKA